LLASAVLNWTKKRWTENWSAGTMNATCPRAAVVQRRCTGGQELNPEKSAQLHQAEGEPGPGRRDEDGAMQVAVSRPCGDVQLLFSRCRDKRGEKRREAVNGRGENQHQIRKKPLFYLISSLVVTNRRSKPKGHCHPSPYRHHTLRRLPPGVSTPPRMDSR
jgi:hypothetical protein